MNTIDQQYPPLESRTMLAYIIVVISGVLLLAEGVLFFAFRWTRMEMNNLFSGKWVEYTLNPWVIWMSILTIVMTVIWWSACRTAAPRWQGIVLTVCCLMGVGIAAWGLTLEPPSKFGITPEGKIFDDPDKMEDGVLPYLLD
jgi:hypothetical protein